MAKIFKNKDSLTVPSNPTIPVIPGDGIGAEIWMISEHVINTIIQKTYNNERVIDWVEALAGQKAYNETGDYLPGATITLLKEHLVSVKGPLMTPVGGGIRSLNVALRKALDLYACVRPIHWYEGVPAPVLHPEHVDMVIFRENTEDIYVGIEWEQDSPESKKLKAYLRDELDVTQLRFPETSALGIKAVSKEGSERLVHAAIQYAIDHQLPSVTLVHKGNIMKFTEGAFRDWGYAIAEADFRDSVFTANQYHSIKEEQGEDIAKEVLAKAKKDKKVIINDCIADAFFQQALLKPQDYSVIATTNLNGDFISDALAAQVGGIGISPGANMNMTTGHAIFEATHGTAPDIAGKNMANPCALLLSVAMLLDYMKWNDAADQIRTGIQASIKKGVVTCDFQISGATVVGTKEFGDSILSSLY